MHLPFHQMHPNALLQGSKNIPAAASLFNEKPVGLFGDKPVRRECWCG